MFPNFHIVFKIKYCVSCYCCYSGNIGKTVWLIVVSRLYLPPAPLQLYTRLSWEGFLTNVTNSDNNDI